MGIKDAIALICAAKIESDYPNSWADLGCGSGLFSKALASLLPDHSLIECCDKDQQVISQIPESAVKLHFHQLDFERELLNVSELDGILMANALHFIKDQRNIILKWKKVLKKKGTFIIVEYDTEASNPWVPFPISFTKLEELLYALDAKSVRKIGERKSIYGNDRMYACEAIV